MKIFTKILAISFIAFSMLSTSAYASTYAPSATGPVEIYKNTNGTLLVYRSNLKPSSSATFNIFDAQNKLIATQTVIVNPTGIGITELKALSEGSYKMSVQIVDVSGNPLLTDIYFDTQSLEPSKESSTSTNVPTTPQNQSSQESNQPSTAKRTMSAANQSQSTMVATIFGSIAVVASSVFVVLIAKRK